MSVLDGPLVFVDIETTGISHSRNRIIEIAAIRTENHAITGTYSSLIDPQTSLPPFISDLTGITNDDLTASPTFYDIVPELETILDGALFVAHNVRFDYRFLKRELADTGRKFNPKLLCTVRLSRSLFPTERHHKLQDLIERCNLEVISRHRAYDDALAMLSFVQHCQQKFPASTIEDAVNKQIKTPSLPMRLASGSISQLPEQPGVYIFQDENLSPLYIGKSLNIKQRVLNHFSSDHSSDTEFKISQQVANIETVITGGELQALLLESRLVKEQQPLYNRQLRRHRKLTLAKQTFGPDGYISISIEDVNQIEIEQIPAILGVYTTKGKAREFLNQTVKNYGLCPKRAGLEKGDGACFWFQLKKCAGACCGIEAPEDHNRRLMLAYESRRLQEWPFGTPILIQEDFTNEQLRSIVVDQWCIIADVAQQPECSPTVTYYDKMFDLDTYKILRGFLSSKIHKLNIKPISLEQLQALSV